MRKRNMQTTANKLKEINIKKQISNNFNNSIDINDVNINNILASDGKGSKFFVLYELNYKTSPSIIKFPEITRPTKDYDRDKYLAITNTEKIVMC